MTNAKVIADSIYEGGPRLTTVEVRLHRFVLAELNTHRALVKNSASSRAIPVAKQLEKVRTDPAYPLSWPGEQRGMQGGAELDHDDLEVARDYWRCAGEDALHSARRLVDLGLHKSVTNRLLEPFMWHTVLLTGTAWENFFTQRCSPLAQPEIRAAAEAIREAMATSVPLELGAGDWHLPYVDEPTWNALVGQRSLDAVKVSVARCARVSYETQAGVRDVEEDLRLYARLVEAQPPHWSPLEHVATPWPENRQAGLTSFYDAAGDWQTIALDHLPIVGSLLGWRTARVEVEAAQDVETFR